MYKLVRSQVEISFIVNSTKMVAWIRYVGSSMADAGCGAGLLLHVEGFRALQRVPVRTGTRSLGDAGTLLGILLNALFYRNSPLGILRGHSTDAQPAYCSVTVV